MKSIVLSLLLVATLSACKSSLGKKVLIDGTKAEVFYKGEGVTEADALKLGDWLKTQNIINNTVNQSVIISKGEDGAYEVRLAGTGEASPERTTAFNQLGAGLSIEVFNNTPVNLVVVDKNNKALQTYPFAKEVATQMQEMLEKAKQDQPVQDSLSTTPVEDSTTKDDQQ